MGRSAGRREHEACRLGLEEVRAAAKRIGSAAYRTPVVTSHVVNDLSGAQVFFKCENLQRVGAFKFRGAYNTVSRLGPEQLRRGVATYSSGNHAQAVALAARLLGSRATIVMPRDAPPEKLDATRRYGAVVVPYDRYRQDRRALVEQVAGDHGFTVIPPFDHLDVIAGQGTVALEFLEDAGALEALVIPVGGGGLISGCAIAAKALDPRITVVGVEPGEGDDTRRSLQAGARVRIAVPHTIADGLATEMPGELTFPIMRRLVDQVLVVSDDEIRSAMALAFEHLKIVVEPSGAAALAVLLAGRLRPLPRRIGVVLTGGNVSFDRFKALISCPARRDHPV
ncbi:pyridoxal-phosphate dependent enzyme [Streptomyces sp. ET3-23]|uniref:pyridoxal-phosphate dependent enzyme n=1 Tax=Streptomyces sp. ET3-23 TaxID=2885643 RepID=UPI001D12283E|nr:pyridoxal-phosphate dependent enzyme [Streptomyces sp. ET3-23]MCC2274967.1 pyridoxal-phosphate dependent enzyme [Streptomyces sp. ET3-23]